MPLNVLLAEDNQGDVLLVREALKEHSIDHQLYVVQDGAQALEFLDRMGVDSATPCPDVFLLDLNLPKADGHEVMNKLRAHPKCPVIPVIVVTSSDAPRDRDRAAKLGATEYFRKPSEIDEFLRLGAVVLDVVKTNAA